MRLLATIASHIATDIINKVASYECACGAHDKILAKRNLLSEIGRLKKYTKLMKKRVRDLDETGACSNNSGK